MESPLRRELKRMREQSNSMMCALRDIHTTLDAFLKKYQGDMLLFERGAETRELEKEEDDDDVAECDSEESLQTTDDEEEEEDDEATHDRHPGERTMKRKVMESDDEDDDDEDESESESESESDDDDDMSNRPDAKKRCREGTDGLDDSESSSE